MEVTGLCCFCTSTPMLGFWFETFIVMSTDKSGSTSASNGEKLLPAVLNVMF